MSSNDVCRLHAEYSTFASKPKKVKFNKKTAHLGLPTDGSGDNEYDAIHDNSYYVTPLPTDDLYLGGEDHDLYFQDDEYTNSDDNNNISSNDSVSESNQNQNQNPGPGYTTNSSSSNTNDNKSDVTPSTQAMGNTIGASGDPSRMYSAAFGYAPTFHPYQGKHAMLCEPSNSRPPQRLGGSKTLMKAAPPSAVQGNVYEERVPGSIENSYESSYSLDSASHSLEIERGSVVFNMGSDAIRHVMGSANSSNDTSSASSGLSSRDGANRPAGETPIESLGMRQSSSLNDVLQALGRIGEAQYFDSSRGMGRGVVVGVGVGVVHVGPEAGYAPYRQVKMHGNTAQHNESREESQGQHGQGYPHARTGYPLKSYIPVPLSTSALPPYLLQTGATFNASKHADTSRTSTCVMDDRSLSDLAGHRSGSSSSDPDRQSHSQSQPQHQHLPHQSYQQTDFSNDAVPLQSYPDRPALTSSYSFPAPGHRSSFISNIAGAGLYKGDHTISQPLSHHTNIGDRAESQHPDAEYAAHTNKSNTFVNSNSYATSSSSSKLANDIHRINGSALRGSSGTGAGSGTGTAHRNSNEQDFAFIGGSNTRRLGIQHDFQSHTPAHPQVHTQTQQQTQTQVQIQPRSRVQGYRDADPAPAPGPLIPPPDTYTSQSVQSLLSRLPQNTHAPSRGGERDDYTKPATPTQIAQTADKVRRDGAMMTTQGAARSVPPVQDPSESAQGDRTEVGVRVGARVGVRVGGQGRNGSSSDHEDIDIMDSSFAADILLAYAAQTYGQTANTAAPPHPSNTTSTQNFRAQFNENERDLGQAAGIRRGESDMQIQQNQTGASKNTANNRNTGNNGNIISFNSIGQTTASNNNMSDLCCTASASTSRKRVRGTECSGSGQGTEFWPVP
jgi:hypothetical protein